MYKVKYGIDFGYDKLASNFGPRTTAHSALRKEGGMAAILVVHTILTKNPSRESFLSHF